MNSIEYPLTPITNTEGGFRGKTFYLQYVDEFFFFKAEDWYHYFLPRFKQDGVAAVMITTPNASDTSWDIYGESSIKFTVDDCSRICKKCIEKMKNGKPKYKDMNEAEKMCISKKHREPITAFWQESANDQSGWSIYMPNHLYLQEFAGVSMSLNQPQFSEATLKMFFSQRAQAPPTYDRIDFCIDNADCGKSFYAISAWVSWLCHTHLLSINDFRIGQAEYSEHRFYENIVTITQRCGKKYNPLKTRVYVWVECNTGHIGTKLAELLKFMRNVYVMRGRKPDPQIDKTSEPIEGVWKGPGTAEKYVSSFQEGLIKNWIKISEDFLTPIGGQEKDLLNKLQMQLKNYVKNEKNKLTGKDSGNDDLCIATIMGPEYIRASNERGSVYNKQLFGNRGGPLAS